jgi:hypothetical protein
VRFDPALVPGVQLELESGLRFPLLRHRFVFEDPDVVVHEFPAVAWHLAAGMSVEIQ